MNDPEQPKDITDGQHDFQSSDTSKKSEPSYTTNFKDKIVGKITSTTPGKADRNDISLSESIRLSNNIRAILMGLFALIGFIILVYAIFTASVSVELALSQLAYSWSLHSGHSGGIYVIWSSSVSNAWGV